MTLLYPISKAVPQSDDYHGKVIEDPFRSLEDVDSADTSKHGDNYLYTHNDGMASQPALIPMTYFLGAKL